MNRLSQAVSILVGVLASSPALATEAVPRLAGDRWRYVLWAYGAVVALTVLYGALMAWRLRRLERRAEESEAER